LIFNGNFNLNTRFLIKEASILKSNEKIPVLIDDLTINGSKSSLKIIGSDHRGDFKMEGSFDNNGAFSFERTSSNLMKTDVGIFCIVQIVINGKWLSNGFFGCSDGFKLTHAGK